MVKLSILIVASALAVSTSSGRITKQQVARRNALPPAQADSLPVASSELKVKRRSSQAGFCRKRAPQSAATSVDTSITGAVANPPAAETSVASTAPSLSIPVPSCQQSSDAEECLPTITITKQVTTSYIDVTSTIIVTPDQPKPTSLGSAITASVTESPASSDSSASSTATSTLSSISSSLAPTSKPVEGNEPSPVTRKCPPGSSWKKVTDNFASFDASKWKKQSGTDEQTSFGPDGMLMKLTEQNANIVYESHAKWISPVTLSASIKSARAGGIVNCAIFGQAGTDEIDLELVEGTYQVPMWHNGKRLEKNKDVTWTLADSSRELASWVFDDRHVVPFGRVHDYTVNWDTEQLTWSIDGKKLLDVKKLPQGAWPDQPLPFRWGPWAADGIWAGRLNWTTNPEPVMQLTSIIIEGCQQD